MQIEETGKDDGDQSSQTEADGESLYRAIYKFYTDALQTDANVRGVAFWQWAWVSTGSTLLDAG